MPGRRGAGWAAEPPPPSLPRALKGAGRGVVLPRGREEPHGSRDHVKVGDREPLSPQGSNLGGKDSEIPAAGAIACPLIYSHLQTFGDTCHLGSDSPRVAHRPQRDDFVCRPVCPGRHLDRQPPGRGREDGVSGEPSSRKGHLMLEEGPGGSVETRGVSRAKA